MIETAQDLLSIALSRLGRNEDDSVRVLLSAAQIVLTLERNNLLKANAEAAAAANRAR